MRGVTCVKGDRHGEIALSESQVERMIRQKVARWTVDGIGLAGILSGGLLVFASLGVLLGMEREALGALCGSLVVSTVLLAIGVRLIYTSQLTWRRRAFTIVTRDLPMLLPACVFLMVEPVLSWADTLPDAELGRYVSIATALGCLVLFCAGVWVCTRLAKGLLAVAGLLPGEGVGGGDVPGEEGGRTG